MNCNPDMMGLADVTKLPVAPDEYTGKASSYITFSYEDERPELHGDNWVLADTAYLQVKLVVPVTTNYMPLKHAIRDYLESLFYSVTSIQSYLEVLDSTKKIRNVVFSVQKTQGRK